MSDCRNCRVVARLRQWMRGATLDSEKLRVESLADIEAVEYDPHRERATVPCVSSGGMPCECRELLTEVLPYVWFQRPDLQRRIEVMVRRDVEATA